MRIDAHQHFWRYAADQFPWITPEMKVLQRDFLPQDLGPGLRAVDIDGTIAVQAREVHVDPRRRRLGRPVRGRHRGGARAPRRR
jgi:predicted TIM-barrel fold metal-dependent hydrolase